MGSSARLRAGLFVRDTRDDLSLIGSELVRFVRREEQTVV